MVRSAIAIVVGAICGLGIFFVVSGNRTDHPVWNYARIFTVYSGSLVSQDLAQRTIRMAVPGGFPDSADQPPQIVEFTYDADTPWRSPEYTFEDGVETARKVAESKPRPLKVGTLLTVIHDVDTPGLRAKGIGFFRRTGI